MGKSGQFGTENLICSKFPAARNSKKRVLWICNRRYTLTGPTENYFLMRGAVMFGIKMLGLVHFDKRKCNFFVHLA